MNRRGFIKALLLLIPSPLIPGAWKEIARDLQVTARTDMGLISFIKMVEDSRRLPYTSAIRSIRKQIPGAEFELIRPCRGHQAAAFDKMLNDMFLYGTGLKPTKWEEEDDDQNCM